MAECISSNTEYIKPGAPGIVSVFLLGMFGIGNARGAFAMLIVSVLANIALNLSPDLAFALIWFVFLSCLAVGYFVSSMARAEDPRAVDMDGINFSTSRGFNQSAIALTAVLIVIYAYR